MFQKSINLFIAVTFFAGAIGAMPQASAQELLGLPAPGTMVHLSPAYQPAVLKGVTVHKDNPFLFDFIVDVGQDRLQGESLKKEGKKLIKYFLASLAIPEKDLWVNLSPYEKDRTIPDALSQTEMGRDLLVQDYILKQITASLIYPEKEMGKTFWDKVYTKAREQFGTAEIPVNTFNKVWIMADKAEVFERNQTAFVVNSHLKVMLEEDYLALNKNTVVPAKAGTHSIGSQIVKDIILPELEREVNTGKNFATLRQISNSLILASWYKKNLKEALLNQVYSDKEKVSGIELKDRNIQKQIYERYLAAYKKGVFNFIKEEPVSGRTTPRKYFSGGWQSGALTDFSMVADPVQLALSVSENALVSMHTSLEEAPLQAKRQFAEILKGAMDETETMASEIAAPLRMTGGQISVMYREENPVLPALWRRVAHIAGILGKDPKEFLFVWAASKAGYQIQDGDQERLFALINEDQEEMETDVKSEAVAYVAQSMKVLGLTADDLSKNAGLTKSLIPEFLRGNRSDLKIETMSKIASALQTPEKDSETIYQELTWSFLLDILLPIPWKEVRSIKESYEKMGKDGMKAGVQLARLIRVEVQKRWETTKEAATFIGVGQNKLGEYMRSENPTLPDKWIVVANIADRLGKDKTDFLFAWTADRVGYQIQEGDKERLLGQGRPESSAKKALINAGMERLGISSYSQLDDHAHLLRKTVSRFLKANWAEKENLIKLADALDKELDDILWTMTVDAFWQIPYQEDAAMVTLISQTKVELAPFSQMLFKARTKKRMDLKEAAAAAGVPRATYFGYERGLTVEKGNPNSRKFHFPDNRAKLDRLADGLGIDREELLESLLTTKLGYKGYGRTFGQMYKFGRVKNFLTLKYVGLQLGKIDTRIFRYENEILPEEEKDVVKSAEIFQFNEAETGEFLRRWTLERGVKEAAVDSAELSQADLLTDHIISRTWVSYAIFRSQVSGFWSGFDAHIQATGNTNAMQVEYKGILYTRKKYSGKPVWAIEKNLFNQFIKKNKLTLKSSYKGDVISPDRRFSAGLQGWYGPDDGPNGERRITIFEDNTLIYERIVQHKERVIRKPSFSGDAKKLTMFFETDENSFTEEVDLEKASAVSKDDGMLTDAAPGGIDLNAQGIDWKIRREGKGVEMTVDPAMIERLKRHGAGSLSPVIFRISPVTTIWPLLGLESVK